MKTEADVKSSRAKEEERTLRMEFIVAGVFLLILGVVIYASPSSIAVKDYFGGLTSGAGLTLVITEIYSIADRRRHHRLLKELSSLEATNKQLIEQNLVLETKLDQVKGQSADMLRATEEKRNRELDTIYDLGWNLGPSLVGAKVNALVFHDITDSLGVADTARRADDELGDWLQENPSTALEKIRRLETTIGFKYGDEAKHHFALGYVIGKWRESLIKNPESTFDWTNFAWSEIRHLKGDGNFTQYVETAFKDLASPSVDASNKIVFLDALYVYFQRTKQLETTLDDVTRFFDLRLVPHDESFAEMARRIIPDVVDKTVIHEW